MDLTKQRSNPLIQFLTRYRDDPVLAVREWWDVNPDPWQRDVLQAYGEGVSHKRIAVRSCPGVGKTALAAWIINHHFLTRFPQRTVITAPGKPQLEDSLWPEVVLWAKRLPIELQKTMDIRTDHIFLVAAPQESYISMRTARAETAENFRGVHSLNTLMVMDEASGIEDAIFLAATGSESDPHFRWLMISNPTRRTGFFYRAQTENVDLWQNFRVAHTDTKRVSPTLVESVRSTYGEDSNEFRVQCLGEFPTEDEDTVIPWELVHAAKERDIRVTPGAGRVWGVDVARFGTDFSALCKRVGNVFPDRVKTWKNQDTMQTAGIIKAEWDSTLISERPQEILIDVIGIGAGVVDRLRELKLPVRGINVGETPASNPDMFANIKAELWFKAREWFYERKGKIPDDPLLIKGLSSTHYGYTSDGKRKLEPKKDTKSAIMKSGELDAADSFILTFASDTATLISGSSGKPTQALKRSSKWVV